MQLLSIKIGTYTVIGMAICSSLAVLQLADLTQVTPSELQSLRMRCALEWQNEEWCPVVRRSRTWLELWKNGEI